VLPTNSNRGESMQLVNSSNGIVLASHVEVAKSFIKRLKGLIGRRGLEKGEALILLPCNCIHTCFMSFPIDILFIDREMSVLHIMENIKPFRFSPIITRSYLVAELPAGSLADTGTSPGDSLQFIVKEATS